MSVQIRCINAEGQPRLTEGAVYDLLFDVTVASAPGNPENKSGYIIGMDGLALPYIFSRRRFVNAAAYVPEPETFND